MKNLSHTTAITLALSCAAATACAPDPGAGDEADVSTDSDDSSENTGTSGTETGTGTTGSDSTGTTGTTDGESGSDTDAGTDTGGPDLCDDPAGLSNPGAGALGHSRIAHWKYDRAAALSINFDDSTPGQATIGVPAMIERGLTGTWFVNPGVLAYQDFHEAWETLAPANFQELANHSMDHAGAVDYADADYQIGEAAAIIRSLYPPERSPLMAFNRGGGTNWNVSEAELQQLLEEHFCVERVNSSGIAPATPGEVMYTDLKAYMQAEIAADNWTRIHFHGICDPSDAINCVCDTPGQSSNCREYGVSEVNNGAVQSTAFLYLLDHLVSDPYFSEQVWIAGFIAAHEYQQAREVSQGVVASASEAQIDMCLISELDPALYDEALTLIVEVPGSWTGCAASQGGQAIDCRLVDGLAQLEARIDGGQIELSPG